EAARRSFADDALLQRAGRCDRADAGAAAPARGDADQRPARGALHAERPLRRPRPRPHDQRVFAGAGVAPRTVHVSADPVGDAVRRAVLRPASRHDLGARHGHHRRERRAPGAVGAAPRAADLSARTCAKLRSALSTETRIMIRNLLSTLCAVTLALSLCACDRQSAATKAATEKARESASQAGDALKKAAEATGAAAKDAANATVNAAKDATAQANDAAKQAMDKASPEVKDAMSKAADATKEAADKTAAAAKEIADKAKEKAAEAKK